MLGRGLPIRALLHARMPLSCLEARIIPGVAGKLFFEAGKISLVAARRVGCARSPVASTTESTVRTESTLRSGDYTQRPKATCTAVYVLNVDIIALHGHAACVACVHMKPHFLLTPFINSIQSNFAPQPR